MRVLSLLLFCLAACDIEVFNPSQLDIVYEVIWPYAGDVEYAAGDKCWMGYWDYRENYPASPKEKIIFVSLRDDNLGHRPWDWGPEGHVFPNPEWWEIVR